MEKIEYKRKGKGKGRELLHRSIAQKALGRKLKGEESIHHVDGNKINNNLSNLVICPNYSYHALLHARKRIIDDNGHPNTHSWCSFHLQVHLKSGFGYHKSTWNNLQTICKQGKIEYQREYRAVSSRW